MGARRTTAVVLSLLLLVGGIGAAVLLRDVGHFRVVLAVVLLLFAFFGDLFVVEAKALRIYGSFLAVVLAFCLLGPSAAVALALARTIVDTARRRPRLVYALNNLGTYAAFPIGGALLVHAVAAATGTAAGDPGYAPIVLAGFLVANVLNFALIAIARVILDRDSLWRQLRVLYLPLAPSQVAIGILAAFIVYVYEHGGITLLCLALGVVVLYQYLLRELLVSQDRAEELDARTKQLASLQVGVLTAMLQTLSLRDKMTARHCAAVARYAREIAQEAGCDAATQDLVHTAGLLHDIGKFIFPDHILLADRKLDDDDWAIVKKHPAQGAKVVRQVEGYGPVADIILAHHERIDGRGYPRGLAGDDIPLLSRMISIADTYDVMTARDSYRDPVSPADAVAELRRVSGGQLDGHLVELFVKVLERKGVAFHHGDDADFESELDLERRVREYAKPRKPVPAAR
jgi:putative nucleotidyltransferase with HDIG domain